MTEDVIRQCSLTARRFIKKRRSKRFDRFERWYYNLARRMKTDGPVVLGSNNLPFEPAIRERVTEAMIEKNIRRRERNYRMRYGFQYDDF